MEIFLYSHVTMYVPILYKLFHDGGLEKSFTMDFTAQT